MSDRARTAERKTDNVKSFRTRAPKDSGHTLARSHVGHGMSSHLSQSWPPRVQAPDHVTPMPEHPILFSSSMTRAILSGTKSQTRRVVRVPAGYEIAGSGQAAGHVPGGAPEILCTRATGSPGDRVVHCPYGEPGHRLWVRETFAPRYFEDGGRPGYRADWDGTAANVAPEPRWKPAIHMSRREARLELEVTDVRVERLQDIREEDALAEGVEAAPCCEAGRSNVLPVEAFRCIWNRINGKREGCAWSANPWVWCVSFRLTVPSTDPHRDEARVADRSAP